MGEEQKPALSRRLVKNLATTFAAIALVCAVLTMIVLYMNFQRTMEHEISEALSHFSQELQRLRTDMLFHSGTLAMVADWGEGEEGGQRYAKALKEDLRDWFLLSDIDFIGSALPTVWEAQGYDLSVFSDAGWSHPQVALHSRNSGELEMLVAIPGAGEESGLLMLASRRLDEAWLRLASAAVEAQVGLCDLEGNVLVSSFPAPLEFVALKQRTFGLADVAGVEYGYKTQRLSFGGNRPICAVVFVPTAPSKGLGYHLALVLFSGMAIAFPLLFWVNRLVMGRAIADMQTLVEWAYNYRRSNDAPPPPEGKFKETQVLSRGFGLLVARLGGAFNEIEQQNRNLEAMVDERTAELKTQHRLLDAILAELPIAVVVLDTHHSVSYANPMAMKAFAIAAGGAMPPSLKLFGDDEPQGQLVRFNARDYLLGVTRLNDPVRIILVATDVTERQAMEEQLLRSQKLESVGRLAGGVAHDFNNALASIIPCVEMLRVTVQNERALGYVDSIEKAATKGAEVVRQLLTFSRTGNYSKQPLAISSVIDNTVKMLRPTARQVEIKWRHRQGLPNIMGSEPLLQQLLLNLSLNALDAMDGVGTIEFEAWTDRERRKVFFSVADSGPGISAEVGEHIFDPFFSTKLQGEGTGLGLAVVYGVVERHEGKIRLISKEGQGARFEIELPVLPEPESGDMGVSLPGSAEEIVIGG